MANFIPQPSMSEIFSRYVHVVFYIVELWRVVVLVLACLCSRNDGYVHILSMPLNLHIGDLGA